MSIKNNLLNKVIRSNFVIYITLTFLTLSIIFSRSFLGIYIFDFRIGEIFMALSAIALIFSLLLSSYFPSKNISKIITVLQIVVVLFVFTSLITKSSFLNLYTYKASSYIWSVGFLFLGTIMPKFRIKRMITLIFVEVILLSMFYVAVFDFPDTIVNLFLSLSDKYEPHKGSDIVLNFIVLNTLISFSSKNRNQIFELFLLNSSLFLPLMLYKSRAGFLATLFFILVHLYLHREYLIIFNFRRIAIYFLMVVLVIVSTLLSQRYVVVEFSETTIEQIPSAFKTLGEYKFSKYKEDYPLFYISEKRIYSGDGNLNDLLLGAGYKGKLTVFLEDNTGYGNDRRGLDGLNEHVHNYFLTIFLRGGVLHLLIFLLFYWKMTLAVNKKNILDFLKVLLPVIFVSMFDSSMENSHFPLIFYYFIGNQFIKK
jgi:hypothetical protein